MKKSSPNLAGIASILAVGLLAGCASSGTSHSRSYPQVDPASAFVGQQMGETIQSIERSLQVLVELERGDEGPRKDNALGMTVAGASGPNKAPVQVSSEAMAASPLGQARIEQNRARTLADLNRRIRLQWTGPADDLLRELSSRVGFSFTTSGVGSAPVIRVDRDDATVEQVLRDIAAQVDKKADIRVDTATRRVTLAYQAQ